MKQQIKRILPKVRKAFWGSVYGASLRAHRALLWSASRFYTSVVHSSESKYAAAELDDFCGQYQGGENV